MQTLRQQSLFLFMFKDAVASLAPTHVSFCELVSGFCFFILIVLYLLDSPLVLSASTQKTLNFRLLAFGFTEMWQNKDYRCLN